MKPSMLQLSAGGRDAGSSLEDLLVSNSRALIVLTTVFFAASAIVIAGSASTLLMGQLFGLSIFFGLLSTLAYRWLEKHYLLIHILWQTGLMAVILTASLFLGRPEILLLAALLPLIAAITLGWFPGILSEALLIGLLLWLRAAPLETGLPQIYFLVIPFFGAFGALLGWITTKNLIDASAWALYSFNQARQQLEEAREQRLELQQTQEDLTKAYQELARLTERLKSLQRVAEEARQAKAEFVANVSHELRTPLNMIIGFSEVITNSPSLYGGSLPVALMTDITAIQRNSKHLLNLVNDVLDLSQVESGRMALSREWISVNAVIREAAAIVESLFQSKGLYLTLDVAADLPQVYCDRTRIRQVIINILSNAGRFTRAGGVRIKSWVGEDSLHVSISDTGPGISAENQKRLFEPFQQLDNSIRRQYGGSGLGLTISKQFIEMHGGRMGLESQPGQGTTFFFSLPLASAFAEDAPGDYQPVRRSLIPGDEFGYSLRTRPSKAAVPRLIPRLVVYEKENSLQRLLTRTFPDTEVIAAATLPEVTAAINRSPAQAVLVNAPPDENETGAIQSLAPIGTPVISCWLPGEVQAASQLGVIQYLIKPITREKLLGVVEALAGEIRSILVVDDEADELHLFARMLESAPLPYQVTQATNGKRALAMLRSRKIDLVLLDMVMPVMDGLQVLKEKRLDASISAIPVIVVSSRDPLGEAISSSSIRISYNGGMTSSHLLEVVQSLTAIEPPAAA